MRKLLLLLVICLGLPLQAADTYKGWLPPVRVRAATDLPRFRRYPV